MSKTFRGELRQKKKNSFLKFKQKRNKRKIEIDEIGTKRKKTTREEEYT